MPFPIDDQVLRVTTVSTYGLSTVVHPVESLDTPLDEYIEKLLEEERESELPVEFSKHRLPRPFLKRLLTGDDPWDNEEVVEYCIKASGGILEVSTRLRYRMVFISWNIKQIGLLTAAGLLKNPSAVPKEYRLEELKRDMLTVNASMTSNQTLEVSYASPTGLQVLVCTNGQVSLKRLH